MTHALSDIIKGEGFMTYNNPHVLFFFTLSSTLTSKHFMHKLQQKTPKWQILFTKCFNTQNSKRMQKLVVTQLFKSQQNTKICYWYVPT